MESNLKLTEEEAKQVEAQFRDLQRMQNAEKKQQPEEEESSTD